VDAKTNSKARQSSRHVADGLARTPLRSGDNSCTPSPSVFAQPVFAQPVFANESDAAPNPFDVTGVFKTTLCIADLQPVRRYLDKELFEPAGLPLLINSRLGHDVVPGDGVAVTEWTLAENVQSLKWHKDQDVVRPADKPILVDGEVVGSKTLLAGAIVPHACEIAVAGPGAAVEKGSHADI
jgi:dihydroxyacid dehydratase/phosphogluconate dehydratase